MNADKVEHQALSRLSVSCCEQVDGSLVIHNATPLKTASETMVDVLVYRAGRRREANFLRLHRAIGWEGTFYAALLTRVEQYAERLLTIGLDMIANRPNLLQRQPCLARNENTDKLYPNQRALLNERNELVSAMYTRGS